jgi:hypothetical protein
MKLERLRKMCLKESNSIIRVGMHLSDMFHVKNGLKQGDALSPCFTTLLKYAITRVQVKQDGVKLNGTHLLLVYADDVNILGGSAHT